MSDWIDKCHFGDCRDTMRAMIADGVKVQTIVTSPPYWGLRDYGVDGQIGLESTLAEFMGALDDVFKLCRELLADDGTVWVNMGDNYVDKQLLGQPWRLAFALQDAGWYLRQDIIWHKPNPMPESTRDRCTKAHEYLFLMTKSPRYYYDQAAIRTPANLTGKGNANGFRGGAYVNNATFDNEKGGNRTSTGNSQPRGYKMPDGWNTGEGAHGSFHPNVREKGRKARYTFKRDDSKRAVAHPGQTMGTHRPDRADSEYDLNTANRRSVWTIPTQSFSGAHFATFPEALVEPCVLAGSRVGDAVFDPFFGSGTTGQVAQRLGRRFIGCELNKDYEPLQRDRLRQSALDLA